MDTAAAGALVGGGASAPAPADGVPVRALRPFLWDGAIREVGAVFTVGDAREARMLTQWNKVELIEAPAPVEAKKGAKK